MGFILILNLEPRITLIARTKKIGLQNQFFAFVKSLPRKNTFAFLTVFYTPLERISEISVICGY